jgi:hypothetical protein
MFEGISAKTAALFGLMAGMAIATATGFRPNLQFDMKVNFQPSNNEAIGSASSDTDLVPKQLEDQQLPAQEPCPACGMG